MTLHLQMNFRCPFTTLISVARLISILFIREETYTSWIHKSIHSRMVEEENKHNEN